MTDQNKSIVIPRSAFKALYSMYEGHVDKKLKGKEREQEAVVPTEMPFIIRLDGVAFSTFTKGIQKPFDHRLTDALVETTKDLVLKFTAATGYAQSDEISLVFPAAMAPPQPETENTQEEVSKKKKRRVVHREHIYGGRIQKLASVTASYASSRLNYHLCKQNWDDLAPNVKERMIGHEAYFDGRVIPMDSSNDIAECIFWRSNCDGLRNAISHISQHYYDVKKLHGLGLSDQVKALLHDKNVNVFKDYSPKILFGTWIKKEQYEVTDMIHPKTGEPLGHSVTRTRLAEGSFNWADWTPEQQADFIIAKYWGDGPDLPPKKDRD